MSQRLVELLTQFNTHGYRRLFRHIGQAAEHNQKSWEHHGRRKVYAEAEAFAESEAAMEREHIEAAQKILRDHEELRQLVGNLNTGYVLMLPDIGIDETKLGAPALIPIPIEETLERWAAMTKACAIKIGERLATLPNPAGPSDVTAVERLLEIAEAHTAKLWHAWEQDRADENLKAEYAALTEEGGRLPRGRVGRVLVDCQAGYEPVHEAALAELRTLGCHDLRPHLLDLRDAHETLFRRYREAADAAGMRGTGPDVEVNDPREWTGTVYAALVRRMKSDVLPEVKAKLAQGGAGDKSKSEGGKPPADPFAELRRFARDNLKGQERAVIEALCDADGELPIADLAVKAGVGWDDPNKGLEGAQRRLNPKIKKLRWKVTRQNNTARLVVTPAK